MKHRLLGWWMSGMLSLGMVQAAMAQPVPANNSPLQTGQRISLDLKGVDILDVLKLLSQKSGLNFVAGRNVSGRVTIFVKDVDVWDAFELIIGANDLAYERQGEIITVMMARDYELIYGEKFQERKQNLVVSLKFAKVAQVSTVLNQVKSTVGRVVADEATNTLIVNDIPMKLEEMKGLLEQLDRPTEMRVYNLNYAEAEKLKEKVQEVLSPVGTFTFDPRTNKAIVSDLTDVLARVDHMIRAFDTPDGQVLIEAKIVNVVLNDELDLGIDWKQVFGHDLSGRANLGELPGIVSGTTLTGKGGGLRMFTGPDDDIQIIIEALKSITETETIASPRILVSNNQEAKILVGRKEAFITSSSTVTATGPTQITPEVKLEDVGTKLFVTPNIKGNGHIQLKIRPEVSSVADTIKTIENTVVPIIQTTEAETNILVKSGVTLIIAGLIDTRDSQDTTRVPGLGSLPVLGIPFRTTNTTKKKTELVVFLTPQIITPDGLPYIVPETVDIISDEALPQVILQDPVPSAYRQAVRRRLQSYLASQFRAASLNAGSVVVSFVLSPEGRLVRVGEITSPQGEQFIQAARQAVDQAQPFPPFPTGSQSGDVRFRLAVEYAP